MDYYLGNLGRQSDSSAQSKVLREMIMNVLHQKLEIKDLVNYILAQDELQNDSISLIIKAICPQYASEYLGLAGDDYDLRVQIFESLTHQFPHVFAFKFYYAECAYLAGLPLAQYFPMLKQAMLSDAHNALYPSAEIFEAVTQSEFAFEFDMLLLEKYYQPCDKETFLQWIDEFKSEYQNTEQLAYLDQLKWKGNS